ncbi:MAG TPA: YidC/Oxa1 family membrane protein insertase [Candidatus Scatavimonas merdigallinarum]|uniref:YidC/Oxa1 family membrane protein insertase n=1 Tax=Candidatus Scatavimonas merdigallinarum TaxID=2840914 RepID=A0A9D1CUU9_9FIRM|nr:YidC/Oxa1 family membrane protein insertase [Candidatus Scatavimonas merdigallinarum]
MDIFNLIGSLFGYVLWFCFMLVHDYGIAIVLFTLFLKIIFFPTSIKQQKSMAANARLAAKQRELQKKYGNDKAKLNEEVSKLYQKEGINPMGGCLSSLLPMLLLLGVYYAVINPLTNTMHIAAETVTKAVSYLNTLPGIGTSFNNFYGQIDIIKLAQTPQGTTYLSGFFDANTIDQIKDFGQGFHSFGLDLLGRPNEGFTILLIIPVLCLVTSVLSQFFTMKLQGTAQMQQGCMKYMLLLMPLLSAYIAYTVPAAVGFYWIVSTVLGFLQTVILQNFYSANIMGAKAEAQRVALLELEEAKVKYSYNPKFENKGIQQKKKQGKKK